MMWKFFELPVSLFLMAATASLGLCVCVCVCEEVGNEVAPHPGLMSQDSSHSFERKAWESIAHDTVPLWSHWKLGSSVCPPL